MRTTTAVMVVCTSAAFLLSAPGDVCLCVFFSVIICQQILYRNDDFLLHIMFNENAQERMVIHLVINKYVFAKKKGRNKSGLYEFWMF